MARTLRPRSTPSPAAKCITLLLCATKNRKADEQQEILINIEGLDTSSPNLTVQARRPAPRAFSNEMQFPEADGKGFRIVGVFGDGGESDRENDFALAKKQKVLDQNESEVVRNLKRKSLGADQKVGECKVGVSKASSRVKKTTNKAANSSSARPRRPRAAPKAKSVLSNYRTRSKEVDPDAEWNAAIDADLAAWKPKPNCRKGEILSEKGCMAEMIASLEPYNASKGPDTDNIVTSFPQKKMDPEAVLAYVALFGGRFRRIGGSTSRRRVLAGGLGTLSTSKSGRGLKFKLSLEELTACKAHTTGAHTADTSRVSEEELDNGRDVMDSLLNDDADEHDVGAHTHGMDDSSHVSKEEVENAGDVMDCMLSTDVDEDAADEVDDMDVEEMSGQDAMTNLMNI
ncbi:hypothetical protein EJ07DRAFT_156892 [Lizonia empirigonia]|nr:hypothetical protein EJ07DRAFT_156892 [Lizonia empirigonia]